MRFPPFFRRAFNVTDFRPGAERNVKEEIGFYLDMRTRELMSDGLDPEAASRTATSKFGDRQWVENECERIEKLEIRRRRRKWMFDSLKRDTQFACRSFIRQPFFSGVVIVMLALGIAGNTAVFSMINAVFLRPFPYEGSDRLVDLDTTAPQWNLEYVGITYPDFLAWREGNNAFDSMGIYDGESVNLMSQEGARRLSILRVSYDMVETLRLVPVLGRSFTPEEEIEGAPNVAMLVSGFWYEYFNGDMDVVGRAITLDGVPYEIIGVLPDEAVLGDEVHLWAPFRADPHRRGSYFLSGIGRLSDGVTIEQAQADLDRVQQGLIDAEEAAEEAMPKVTNLRERIFGDVKTGSFVVWGAVAVLLLIACANIGSLMLAKSSVRKREFGIRASIGAGRGSIVRQLLTESMILALAGGIAGFLLGIWGVSAIEHVFPIDLPPWASLNADLGVTAFSFAACAAAAILFGLLPALRSTRGQVADLLTEGLDRSSATTGTKRLMRAFVSVEVALALGLMVTASLLIQAFRNLGGVDPGYDPEGVLVFQVDLPEADYPEAAQLKAFYDALLERLGSLPGVESASAASSIPLRGHQGYFFVAEGASPPEPGQTVPVTLVRFVTLDYPETVGLRLKSGRFLNETDSLSVVVNETFARHHWGEEDPVGRRILLSGSTEPVFEVVGLACDVKHYGLEREMRPGIYIRMARLPENDPNFLMRTSVDPLSLTSAARAAVSEIDPTLPVYGLATMREMIDDSLSFRKASSTLIGVFALVSLILALGGVYGVISYVVSQRTREIGLRIALGARRSRVVRMVLIQGAWMILIGCAFGVGLILVVSGVLSSLMFGIDATDPLTIAGVTVMLLIVALPANLIPALRVSAVDPVTALRVE